MKIAYAFRRTAFYPHPGDARMVPEGPVRSRYLTRVGEIGFDGVELGIEAFGGLEATERSVLETRKELEDHGTPCVVVRAGGALGRPDVEPDNRRRLEKAVDVAHWLGADTVNTALSSPPKDPTAAGALTGQPISQGSSRIATSEEFERTAQVLHEMGEKAGAWGINITVEVHQHSIADNSWSTMRLLELAGSPHVFANPDLGNIYWTYEVPEETSEEAIVALAPYSKYWHCKNLYRVHAPEIERAIFIRVPLPDGEIDYRYAISAMHDAGFDGYLAIEGATAGDQLEADRRSFEYVKAVLRELEESAPAGPGQVLS